MSKTRQRTRTTVMEPPGSARRETLLLLDVNGVLFTDPLPPILRAIAGRAGTDSEPIARFYRDVLRIGLWSGRMGELEFWDELLSYAGIPINPDAWRERLIATMRPLPAARRLPAWAGRTTIWLFSNQRSEWLEPSIERHRLASFIGNSFISDRLGLLKPDPRCFTVVRDAWPGKPGSILFIDDQRDNLAVAQAFGFHALHARRGARWIPAVDLWTSEGCR
jgi:FMN phosphatase YigB (HAD superfamily)